MNVRHVPKSIRWSVCTTAFFLAGLGWHVNSAFAEEARDDAADFADEPAAHKLYDRMLEALDTVESL